MAKRGPTETAAGATIYTVQPFYRWIGLMLGSALILFLPLLAAFNTLTNPESLLYDTLVLPVIVGLSLLMVPLGAFVYGSVVAPRLVVSRHGISYSDISLRIETGWDNITSYGEVRAGRVWIKGLLLRKPAAQMSNWLQGYLFLQPLLIVLGALAGRPFGTRISGDVARVIPLASFTSDWRNGQLGAQLRAYAPHLFGQDDPPGEARSVPEPEAPQAAPSWRDMAPQGFIALACLGFVVLRVVTLSDGPVAQWPGHRQSVNALAVSADGAIAASGGSDGSVRLWELGSNSAYAVAFSPDGTRLAVAEHNQRVTLWDVATGEQLQILGGLAHAARAVAFTHDGTLLAGGDRPYDSYDGPVPILMWRVN